MILRKLVERFEKQAPACMMVRASLENIFSAERLDGLFEDAAQRQENKRLLFSTVADLMGLVAAKVQPSVHAGYQAKKAEVGVTIKAVYDKLQRMEANISRELVRETAGRMAQIVRCLRGERTPLLPGYRVKILDGNHLRRTQRRLRVLTQLNAAPLPGQCLVVLDPDAQLAIDVFPCEDGHAQERSLLPAVLETVQRRDVWIGDRNFCTTNFLLGIAGRQGKFVIRQHGRALRYELIGKRRQVGRSETGLVYEQRMRLFAEDGKYVDIRRVSVELNQPTRDGDLEIHILTNLPASITALRVAALYQDRWTIETAFCEVATNLNGEIETLGYPRAALFAFCMALVVFNVYSLVRAALRAAHGEEKVEREVSLYYLAHEVSHTYQGQEIAIGSDYWVHTYASLTPARLAQALLRIARQTDLSRYQKHPRGPKKPKLKLPPGRRGHVATARILAAAKE